MPAADVSKADRATVDASDEPPLDARLAPGEDLTALVVDDSTVNRRILAGLLESAGVRVITAAGGEEALRLTREHRPDVIFMDLRMTDLDGLEATRRLEADPLDRGHPGHRGHGERVRRVRARRHATPAASTTCPSRCAPSRCTRRCTRTWAWSSSRPPAPAAPSDPELSSNSLRLRLAMRLHEAAGIGNVTDLEALAQELVAGDAGEAAIGQRIARMTAQFDFDGLADLARRLAGERSATGVGD